MLEENNLSLIHKLSDIEYRIKELEYCKCNLEKENKNLKIQVLKCYLNHGIRLLYHFYSNFGKITDIYVYSCTALISNSGTFSLPFE